MSWDLEPPKNWKKYIRQHNAESTLMIGGMALLVILILILTVVVLIRPL